MCAKRKDSTGFRLDVCKADQSKLEKLFNRPGTCYGDLRRQRIVSEAAERRLGGHQHADLERDWLLEDTEDEYADQARRLDEQIAAQADREPCLGGGTAEKKNAKQYKGRRNEITKERANNARQHRFARPSTSRELIRRYLRRPI